MTAMDPVQPVGEDLAQAAVSVAAALVCAVEDQDTKASHGILSAASVPELQALAVVLAAMVPSDRGVASLLARVHREEGPDLSTPTSDWSQELLEEAHATWVRIRSSDRTPPAWVSLGETEYQHRRIRLRMSRGDYLRSVNAQAMAIRSGASA